MRAPWTTRRSSQSIKEINPEYSLEVLVLKLWLPDSLEKTLILGKIEGRGKGASEDEMVGWHHPLNGHGFEQTLEDSEGQGSLACCNSWIHRVM